MDQSQQSNKNEVNKMFRDGNITERKPSRPALLDLASTRHESWKAGTVLKLYIPERSCPLFFKGRNEVKNDT